jgi:hypothetical protein
MLRFAVDFLVAEPLRFAAVFAPLLRLALDLAVERLAVVLFLAVARFAEDLLADLAVLRPADFLVAVRDAVLRAPVVRLELERFAVDDLRAPDLAEDAFFVAAIGTPPELEWSALKPPDGLRAERPHAGVRCGLV